MQCPLGETAKGHAKNPGGQPNAKQDCLLTNDRPHAAKNTIAGLVGLPVRHLGA